MREIKFRAWDGGNMFLSENRDLYDMGQWFSAHSKILSFEKDPKDSIIMQFTGLKDKNGKEIYEGDIISTETDKLMVVSWINKFASFCIKRDGWMFQHFFGEACNPEHCEVIGNIHENKDLIEKEDTRY